MSEEEVILEGPVKHRDGKKWKSRWCVVRRLSPVADSVELSLYSSCPDDSGGGVRLKAALSLQRWLGALPGPSIEQQSHTLLLLCADAALLLALPARRTLLLWTAQLHALLGAAQQYDVALLGGLQLQPAVLLLQGGRLALVQGKTPTLKGVWEIHHLRRFGVVEGCFAWEGGALSGAGAGTHCVAAAPADVTRLQRDVVHAARGLLPPHRRDRHTNNTDSESPVVSRASEAGSLRRSASRSASPSSRGIPRCVSCAAGLGSAFSGPFSLVPPRPHRPAYLPLACQGHQQDELCSAPTSAYDNYDVPRVPSIDAEGEYYDTPRRLRAVLGCMSRSLTVGALGHPTALYATIDRSRKRPRRRPNYENSMFAHSLRLYENARDLLPASAANPVLARTASAEYLPMRPLPRSPSRAPSDPLLLVDDVTYSLHPSNRHSSSSADSGVVLDPTARRCCRSYSLSPPPRPPPPRPSPCSAEAAVPLFPCTQTDTHSTSSATSDLSDCFETMSLSSHSSLDANRSSCRSHTAAAPTLGSAGSLRPRSGREYVRPLPPQPPAAPHRPGAPRATCSAGNV